MNELNKLLTKVCEELNVPKSRRNSFGNYYYRSLEDIYEAVKPLLTKYNLSLKMVDGIEAHGDRVYVRATATLSDGENHIHGIAFAREAQSKKGFDDSQITGTASSYARKYALSGLFLLDDVKDADTDEYTLSTGEVHAEAKFESDDDKPWLNEGTPEWNKAETFVSGGGDPYRLREKYKVSNQSMDYFKSI